MRDASGWAACLASCCQGWKGVLGSVHACLCPPLQVQFSPDGRWLVSASFDKAIKLWDGVTGSFVATLRGHVGPVYQVAWSADSRLFVSGSKDSTLKARLPPNPGMLPAWLREADAHARLEVFCVLCQ